MVHLSRGVAMGQARQAIAWGPVFWGGPRQLTIWTIGNVIINNIHVTWSNISASPSRVTLDVFSFSSWCVGGRFQTGTAGLDCNVLYAGVNQSSLSRLQLVQNAAVRFLTGKKKREHITPILVHLHWLPVQFRIEYKVSTFVLKALHGLFPVYISDLISPYSPRRSLRSSSENLLTVPLSRLKSKGDRAFSVFAPKLWNSLPKTVRLSSSLSGFKSSLKTYLFSQAYS